MTKQTVVIQLIVDSRMIWQVKTDVARDLCRRMTESELNAVGRAVEDALEDIVTAKPAAVPEPARKKR